MRFAGSDLYFRPNYKQHFSSSTGEWEIAELKMSNFKEYTKGLVSDSVVGKEKLDRSVFRHGLEPFEVGRDSITPVDPAYKDKGDFEFTGTIEKVEFDLK